VFEAKVNYITAGMALVFLLLLGRYAYMQVFAHDYYAGLAQDMRTNIALLEPQRADIVLRDGTVVAHTESVWDIYIDYEAFADPRGMLQRAHASPSRYDPAAVESFLRDRLAPVQQASLPGPSGRRRFFYYWQLRQDPAAVHDREVCIQRLCLVTGLTRGELELKLQPIETEVNTLMEGLGDPQWAESREVSIAWLRARPALTDPEYWERIRRFPKSLHFAPVLAARLDWLRKEAAYIEGLVDAADGDGRMLRDLCYRAMQTCRERAESLGLDVEAGELTLSQAQDILLEEHDAWLRLAVLCEEVVRGHAEAVIERQAELTGRNGLIRRTEARLENLQTNIIGRYLNDWNERWRHYDFDENPLLLLRDAPRDMVELLKVNGDLLPGVTCKRRAARRYSFSRELAHVIGGVGLPDPAVLERVLARPTFGEGLDDFIDTWFEGDRERFTRRFEGVVAHQMVGTGGVERVYDERLTGLYGARAFIRDARGRIRNIEYEKAPVHQAPLTLTLDIELQRDIQQTVKKWEPLLAPIARKKSSERLRRGVADYDRWERYKWTMRGAAVVLDVETGAVLAMVSFPDYDPDRLIGRSPADRAYQRQFKLEQEIEGRKGYPWWNRQARMYNRASHGRYAPGSTFKVMTSIALLESGAITRDDTFGEFSEDVYLGEQFLGRTGHPAHESVNLVRALELSSNGYFYRWAQALAATPQESWDELRMYTEDFGIGMPMTSDIWGAKRGSLPESDRVWAQNLAMLSIGQGEMTTTPLEIARLYAAIANRGDLVVPHLTDEAMIWPRQVDVSDETWDLIHEGMRKVVFGGRGTANDYDVLKRIRCAGKTGTAENGKGVPDHAWFAGFAPHDNPKVAFVILAANSDLYGAQVAPVIGECIERYLKREGILDE
jgi:cell division protein FtsI/penicillin-binding protein 2